MPIKVTNLDGGQSVHVAKNWQTGEYNIERRGMDNSTHNVDQAIMNYEKLLPILGDSFREAPMHFPLCENSEFYDLFANVPQADFQKSLDRVMARNNKRWSISGYLENRITLLKNYPQMVSEGRFYHLGIDINAPCGTKLYAPFDCEVVTSTYEEGDGNYGGIVVLKCQRPGNVAPFYLLFGHLNPDKLPEVGVKLKRSEAFAEFGDMNQNGNWFYHTHLQVLTQRAFDDGWVGKGYCKESEIAMMAAYCPNPLTFL